MAVSEACALVLPAANPGSDLVAGFSLARGVITAVVTVAATDPEPIDLDSWAWQVLSALSAEASEIVTSDQVTVSLTLRSAAALPR
jgi:serine/threonine-protein kinase RsbW